MLATRVDASLLDARDVTAARRRRRLDMTDDARALDALVQRARASTPDGADAVRQLRNLCVDAEGPAAPFTKTPRGAMLVALISVVVRNVGLQDKVGALRALSLLKANDDALRRAARAGAVPALAQRLRDEDGAGRTSADAARALGAMASSSDVCQMMIRSGVLGNLSEACARAASEETGEASETARFAADALRRLSGRSDAYDSRALFPISSDPSALDLTTESAVRSVVEVLMSEATVAHGEASAALGRIASSGATGRRAVARCGAVLPLVTAALGGERQRNASLAALRSVAGVDAGASAMNGTTQNDGWYSDSDSASARRDREELTMAEKLANANGTASSLGGLNFFHDMIDLLSSLLELRHSLEPAAADAALALWALAWQPSNREHMTNRVTARLMALAREGCATSRDDALSVLSVLALDEGGREAIHAQTGGAKLLDYLQGSEGNSPRAFDGETVEMSFDELIERRSPLGDLEKSSTGLSAAVSRMHCA